MKSRGAFKVTLDMDILPLRRGRAYTIQCEEWEFLKEELKKAPEESRILYDGGLLFVGGALALLISLWVGSIAPGPRGTNVAIAWILFSALLVVGGALMFLGHWQHKRVLGTKTSVAGHMTLIEDRFDHGEV